MRPLTALATLPWHVIAVRAGDRVGKGLRTAPRDVMIADVTAPELRGRAFGLHRVGDHTGAILGPLVAALLISGGMALRRVFWFATVPGVVAVMLAAVAVRKAARNEERQAKSEPEPATAPALRSSPFAPLLLVLALATFLRVPETLLILRTQ